MRRMITLLVASLVRRRGALARDLTGSGVLALGVAVAVGAVVTDGAWDVLTVFAAP